MNLNPRKRNASVNNKRSTNKSHTTKTQIAELNRKIADVEAQKASLETAEELPAQEVVDHEVLKGISHGEKALKIEANIKQLCGKKSFLDNRIVHEIISFVDFKSRFLA